MTIQINPNSGEPIKSGNKAAKPAKQQNPKVSIFSDKNNNDIVDRNDFNDEETANLAFEKGLIGRKWESVKGFINKVLAGKDEDGITQERRYNEQTNEHYTATIKNGQEITRTYYKENGTIDEMIHIEYDNNGQVITRTSVSGNGNLRYTNEYDDNKQVRQLQYEEEDGSVRNDFRYKDGNIIEGTGYRGNYIQHQTYDENKNVTSDSITYTGDIVKYSGDNDGEVAKFISSISDVPSDNEIKRVIQESFGDKMERMDNMRGGFMILLKDGTYIDYDPLLNETKFTKPNGSWVIYSRFGEAVEEKTY